MTQQLLAELEALREAHRTAKTPADFDALAARMYIIEELSSAAAERSKGEEEALRQVKSLVSAAIETSREGRKQPAALSAAVFTLMQAVRRGTTGYERWPKS